MEKSTLVFPIGKGTVWLARKKRGVGKGLYNGWGGTFEPQDHGNPRLCACREFNEECGATTSPNCLYEMAVVDFFEDGEQVFECHVYFLSWWEGKLQESEEMEEPEEFRIAELPYSEMMTADREWLAKLFLGKRFRAKVCYGKGNKKVESIEYGPL